MACHTRSDVRLCEVLHCNISETWALIVCSATRVSYMSTDWAVQGPRIKQHLWHQILVTSRCPRQVPSRRSHCYMQALAHACQAQQLPWLLLSFAD